MIRSVGVFDVPMYHNMVSMIVTMVFYTMHDRFAQRTEIYKSSKIQSFTEGQLAASGH